MFVSIKINHQEALKSSKIHDICQIRTELEQLCGNWVQMEKFYRLPNPIKKYDI